jgi:hypothetical protein
VFLQSAHDFVWRRKIIKVLSAPLVLEALPTWNRLCWELFRSLLGTSEDVRLLYIANSLVTYINSHFDILTKIVIRIDSVDRFQDNRYSFASYDSDLKKAKKAFFSKFKKHLFPKRIWINCQVQNIFNEPFFWPQNLFGNKKLVRRRVLPIEILYLEQVCWHRSCKYFGEKNTMKKSADLHPRQGTFLQRNNFSAVNKTSLHFTK